MKSSPILPCLGLAGLLGSSVPAMAEKKFINRSEFLICLVPDPKHPPTPSLKVTPGSGCQVRDRLDPAEATTLREETKAAGARNAPIALATLPRNRMDTWLFLDPEGSVTFSAVAGGALASGTAPEIRFRVCTVGLGARDGEVLQDEFLFVGLAVKPSEAGDLLERLTWGPSGPEGAKSGGSDTPLTFQPPDSQDPDLRLVNQAESAHCSIQ